MDEGYEKAVEELEDSAFTKEEKALLKKSLTFLRRALIATKNDFIQPALDELKKEVLEIMVKEHAGILKRVEQNRTDRKSEWNSIVSNWKWVVGILVTVALGVLGYVATG